MKIILSILCVLCFSLNAVSISDSGDIETNLDLGVFGDIMAVFPDKEASNLNRKPDLKQEENVSKFILSVLSIREKIKDVIENKVKITRKNKEEIQFFIDFVRRLVAINKVENSDISLQGHSFLQDILDPAIKDIFAQIAMLPTGARVFLKMQNNLNSYSCEKRYLLEPAIKICELNRDKPIMLAAMRAFEQKFSKLTEDIETVSKIRNHYGLIEYTGWCFRDIFRWYNSGGEKFNTDQLSHLCNIIIIQIKYYFFHECPMAAEQVRDVHLELLRRYSKLSNSDEIELNKNDLLKKIISL